MKNYLLPLVAALALGFLVLMPSSAEARWYRHGAYHPAYSYGYRGYYGRPYYYRPYYHRPYYYGNYYGYSPYMYTYGYPSYGYYYSPGFSFYIR